MLWKNLNGNKNMFARIFMAPLLLGFSFAANALTIDFESDIESIQEDSVSYIIFRTQGFEFESVGGAHFLGLAPGSGNSSPFYCYWCSATMTAIDYDTFDLQSFDMASVYPTTTSNDILTITGYYQDGGSISVDINVTSDFGTYNFDDTWSGLSSIEFGTSAIGNAIGLDNVAVSVVPVPAAVWLFGSALAGLGWMRRKQTI